VSLADDSRYDEENLLFAREELASDIASILKGDTHKFPVDASDLKTLQSHAYFTSLFLRSGLPRLVFRLFLVSTTRFSLS
jgi:hypothetical protein